MPVIYQLTLSALLVLTAPLWLIWMMFTPKIRAGFWQKCGFFPTHLRRDLGRLTHQPRTWLHAVSVGEFNAARPLIERLQSTGHDVVISTTTLTGQTLARQTYPDLNVFYFPFDMAWPLAQAFKWVKPSRIMIMETEIWPGFLWAAKKHGVPVTMVNARLSDKSFKRYCRFKGFLKSIWPAYKTILTQSEEDAGRFLSLGALQEQVKAVGNIKYEITPHIRPEVVAGIKTQLGLSSDTLETKVLVAASTHPGEEPQILSLFGRLLLKHPTLRLVLAPRHPERRESVLASVKEAGYVPLSRQSGECSSESQAILVLDTIGELVSTYALADVVLMGGSFVPWGGHNPLEATALGKPVVMGPHMHNFKTITQDVVSAGVAFQTLDTREAQTMLERLLTDHDFYQAVSDSALTLMDSHQGVLDKIMQALA